MAARTVVVFGPCFFQASLHPTLDIKWVFRMPVMSFFKRVSVRNKPISDWVVLPCLAHTPPRSPYCDVLRYMMSGCDQPVGSAADTDGRICNIVSTIETKANPVVYTGYFSLGIITCVFHKIQSTSTGSEKTSDTTGTTQTCIAQLPFFLHFFVVLCVERT